MESFESLLWLAKGLLIYTPAFLVAILIIVFVHEFGHFIVARWCGVKIEAFSIGFGREITGWFDKHGTRWKLCLLPLGGYVKFLGDSNAASMPEKGTPEKVVRDPGNFHGKPVWQRAAIVAAGPIANFILAVLIFAASYMIVGKPIIDPRVDEIEVGSAAEKAGFKPGDLIVEIDGRKIESFGDIQRIVTTRPGESISIVVIRDGANAILNAVPELREVSDGNGGKIRIGILGLKHNPSSDTTFRKMGPGEALTAATDNTWYIISTTMKYIGKIVTGRESTDQLGGPIAMAKAAGDAASLGIAYFVSMIAFLSVSIGLINLFPIPMLDGGHLVFYGLEALRGKPLGPQAQEWGFRIGVSFVIMLMVIGTWNDVVRAVSVALGG